MRRARHWRRRWWRPWPPGCGRYHAEAVARFARASGFAILLLGLATGFVAGAGSTVAYTHAEHISFERAIYILDTEPAGTQQAGLAQARLKALVSIACATLAREAASGGTWGEDAARFLRVLKEELPR